MKLTWDSWRGKSANLQAATAATWQQIADAMHRLDATVHTEVLLKGDASMSIGGGAGQYFVSIFTRDDRSLVLTDRCTNEVGKVLLQSAGQRIALPRNRVVGIDDALQAASWFFETEEADTRLVWIEE